MPSLSAILDIVIRGNNNFCCLCLKTDENFSLHDQISIQITETERIVTVTDVLHSLFGQELQEYLSIFENICEDCIKSVVSIYTFIQTQHYNAMLLMQSLNGLNNSFDHIKDRCANSKSLFVSLKINDFTSKHIYDTKKIDSTDAALKRFIFLNAPKTKKVFTDKNDLTLSKSNKTNTVSIKTSDMLLNSNNKLLHKCKMCSKVYFSLCSLRAHFLKAHAPKDYQCPKCPKTFSSPNLVNYHLSITHFKTVCNECGKVFKNKTTLKKHKLGHCVKLVCPKCGRTYKSEITYKKHLESSVCKLECRANPANAQFTCDYCGKKYTQKMSLRVHIQYEHGNYKPHICEWCGKKFWAQSRLKAHIVTHTQEKNFTCSTCQGKFVTKESLLYHTRLHTGEKPYKCSECNCTFISTSRRAYHMKAYHLLANEECDICHSKFTSRSYLNKHKETHKHSQDGIVLNPEHRKDDSKQNESQLAKRIINETSASTKIALVNIEIPELVNEEEINNQSNNQIMYQEYSSTLDINNEYIMYI